VRDGVAVDEMADVSGLRLLPPDQLAARDASSYGTGEVVGFKCFLLHSGVDEFPPLDPEGPVGS
jgi:glycerate kinase